MTAKNIKAGDRLEISLKRNSDANSITYVSQVENVLDKGIVVIHKPISHGKLVKLKSNEIYSILFFTEKGMIKYDVGILKHYIEGGFDLTVIKLLTNGMKIQRREFFRFTCLLNASFEIIEEEENLEEIFEFKGFIKDIGGGGIRISTNENVLEGKKIKCMIRLEKDILIAFGKILQKQYFSGATYKYQYRVEFVALPKLEQEKIIQYIFEQQRKILNKIKV